MTENLMYCSFCRKDHEHVDALVGGPGVFICDACTHLAVKAIAGETLPDFAGWKSLDDESLLASLVAAEDGVRRVRESVGEQVKVLRDRDVSWARIGDALGISRQAAWERFASLI